MKETQEVQVVDRSDMEALLKERLVIDPKKTAVIAVDMHRGHLDPSVATMPTTAEDATRVIESTQKFLGITRNAGIPVIHVILIQRDVKGHGVEGTHVKFWKAVEDVKETITPGRASTIKGHNLEGSVQTEIIPELYDPTDYVISNKKRLSAFYGTDLEILLRVMKVETAVVIGINTNTCVLCTAFECFNRDLAPVVISDCVASMYGEDLHVFGLQNVKRCLGWVLSIDEFVEKLKASESATLSVEMKTPIA